MSPGLRFAVATTFAVVLLGCSSASEDSAAPRPVVVESPQPVTEGVADVYPGAVRARVEADLSFRVAGKIASREVDAGAAVKAGQVLATLDPKDAQLNLEAARTAVASSKADLQLAISELRRYRDLKNRGFVGQSAVDQRESQYKVASARVDQAEAQLALARNQSRYTSLVADKDGVITAVLAEAGQVAAAGQPVFRFAAQNGREVAINVPEGKLDGFKPGRRLRITLWAVPGRDYDGVVREVVPAADPVTRTHEVRVSFAHPDDDVRLGMTATVHAGTVADAALFRLPLSALGEKNGQPAVWRVDSQTHKVNAVPVQVARYLENAVLVSGPLSPSDRIVTAGVHLLTEGETVRTVERTRSRS